MNTREHESVVEAERPAVRASVVIPVFNKVELTVACVESLIESGWSDDDELIVVDNASTDGTPDFLASLEGDVTVIRNEVNRNFAGASNQGARAAQGRWVVFLNNDTIVAPGWIDGLVQEAEREDAQVVGCRLLYPDGSIQHGGVGLDPGVFPRHLWRGMPGDVPGAAASFDCQMVTAACMLFDRELFLEVGGFDEQFINGCEDIDLCFRAREHGARIRYCGGVAITHCESMSPGRHERDEANTQRLLDKWLDRLRADRISAERIVALADEDLPWARETVRASIIVPAGEDAQQLDGCVASLLDAGLAGDVEVIVAVAAPGPEVLAVCDARAGEVRIAYWPEPIPDFGRRNLGLAHSLGEVVALLDPSVAVKPGWLEAMRKALASDPGVGIVGPPVGAGGGLGIECCAVRRDVLVRLSGFHEDDRGIAGFIGRIGGIGASAAVVSGCEVELAPPAKQARVITTTGTAESAAGREVGGGVAIAGMHRSGTSMVTRLLNLCGLSLGPEGDLLPPTEDNPKGYWESRSLMIVNDALLAAFGGGWDFLPELPEDWAGRAAAQPSLGDRARAQLDVLQASGATWGWKDPRNSVTFPFWRQFVPGLRAVVCLRNPVEVADSLHKRGYASRPFAFNLWLGYNRAVLANTAPEERIVTHYDSYFTDPIAELSRVAGWIGLPADDAAVADACATTDLSMRHSRATIEHLFAASAPATVIETYVALCREAGPVYASVLEREIAAVAEAAGTPA